MIPLKLTFCGVYSYQQEQQIDFAELIPAQIFGIFGAVGSGKSAILEMITISLYGKSERLTENRNYNLMNLKSNRLWIDFEFEAGKPSTRYRMTVEGKRNTKRFEEVKAYTRKAYRWESGVWQPLETANGEEVLGLSYQNFNRTIIIPQGKFQEFLELKASDRTRMMQELFGLEQYDLFQKTTSLEKQNLEQLNLQRGQLEQLNHPSPEKLEELQKKRSEIEAFLEKRTSELQEKEVRLQELEALKKQILERQQLQNKAKKLEVLASEMEAKKALLKDYETVQSQFRVLWESCQQEEKASLLLAEEMQQKRKEEAEKRLLLKQKEASFLKLKQFEEEREQYQAQTESLKKLIRLRELNEKQKTEEQRVEKGTKMLEELVAHIAQSQKQADLQKEQLEVLKKGQNKRVELLDVKNWATTQKHILAQQHKLVQQEKILISQQEKVRHQLPENLGIKTLDSAEALQELNTQIQAQEQRLKQFEEKERKLSSQQQLSAFAQELKEGAPCPVCGATHHPQKMNEAHLSRDIKALQKQIVDCKEQLKIQQFHAEKVRTSMQLQASFDEQQQALTKEMTLLKQEQEKLEGTYKWTYQYKDIDVLEQDLLQAEKQCQQYEKEQDIYEKEQKKREQDLQKQRSYEEGLNRLKLSVEADRGVRQLLQQEVGVLFEEKQEQALESLKLEIEKREKELKTKQKQFAETEQELTQMRTVLHMLEGQISEKQSQFLLRKKNLKEAEEAFEACLKASHFENKKSVIDILQKPLDVQNIQKELEDYRIEVSSTSQLIEQLDKQINHKQVEEAVLEQTKKDVERLKQEWSEKQEQLGGIKGAVEELKERLAQSKTLKESLEKLEVRAENVRILKKLFTGNGFVKYISGVYLQELCVAANTRFTKLTRQRLQLELNKDNSFIVRDYMNEGRLRSASTLSGGQKFQISLSLALALAERVQKESESSQNFFFLDEGFGTLDKESLSIVLETLKLLRHENRIVGVISHLEVLQQEIDRAIYVKPDEGSGSHLEFSWL